MANPVIEWAKDNPLLAGGAALAIVLVVALVAGGGSAGGGDTGDSGGMGSAGVQAYYAAVANQSQAGAAIQTTQIKANAETNRALIAASYGLEAVKVQSSVQSDAVFSQERVAMGWQNVEREQIQSTERLDADTNKVRLALGSGALATKRLSTEQRGAVLQSAITGKVVPVMYKPINPGNSASSIIGAGANVLKTVLPFV